MLKRSLHTPAHLMLDDRDYFITAAIYEKRRLLAQDSLKEQLLAVIKESFAKFGWQLNEWVILDNHYHLLGRSAKGVDLPKLMARIHSHSSSFIHKANNCALPIWWNYWDYCPCNERDYHVRQNYLFNNPFKHGYVTDLKDYRFSSFQHFLAEEGRNTLVQQFKKYKEYQLLQVEEDDF